MPELSRFYGIIIRMFVELGTPHHRPHFHAYYQNEVGIFSLQPVELMAGGVAEAAAAAGRGLGGIARD